VNRKAVDVSIEKIDHFYFFRRKNQD